MVFLRCEQSHPLTRRSSSFLPVTHGDSVSPYRYREDRRRCFHGMSLSQWTLVLFYGLVIMYCCVSARSTFRMSALVNDLESELESLTTRREHTIEMIKDSEATNEEVIRDFEHLRKTQERLKHELRVKEELHELQIATEYKDYMMGKMAVRRKEAAMTWIQQRQEALFHKIYSLQDYIRAESRTRVLEKYGPGPHRVQFLVKTEGDQKRHTLMVELAPVDLVPHAIETFLDMVSNKVWDNTVFYHHSSQHHIIVAAPVNYGSFTRRESQSQALELGLSFPDYSEEFPHEEYTIGFSGTSTNLIINTISNVEIHGPGGQAHGSLAKDADPCFGKIVWGKNVVKEMMPANSRVANPKTFQDFDLTQILQVRLM